jgi:heat shock protein HslJ
MKKTVNPIRLATLVGMVILLATAAACNPEDSLPDTGLMLPDDQELRGTTWTLLRIGGEELIPGTAVTISFTDVATDDVVEGEAGCNSYGGVYSTGLGNELSIRNVVRTEVFCMEPEGVMEQEEEFLRNLERAEAFDIMNDRLEIQDQAGQTLMIFTRQ